MKPYDPDKMGPEELLSTYVDCCESLRLAELLQHLAQRHLISPAEAVPIDFVAHWGERRAQLQKELLRRLSAG